MNIHSRYIYFNLKIYEYIDCPLTREIFSFLNIIFKTWGKKDEKKESYTQEGEKDIFSQNLYGTQVPTWKKKLFWEGGGGEYDFLEKYIP